MIFGAAVGLGLAGCSTGQGPGPGRSESPAQPKPSPTPLPGTVAAAARENDLAGFAAAALTQFAGTLSTADRNLLSRLRDAHLAHAAVLARQDPTAADPSAAATPSPTPGASSTATPPMLGHGPKAVRARLRTLESRAAGSYAELAVSPRGTDNRSGDQEGRLALFWGSLATASTSYAQACRSDADPGSAVIGDQRTDVALPDRATAIQNLLAQCYAIIFGYQSALPRLSAARAELARDRLTGYRDLRDRLSALLDDQHLSMPGPDAAYRLPIQPTSNAAAARLINIMETRMLPYFGQWLATAQQQDRADVLKIMSTSARDDLEWSPKIIVWPGYPTV